jgi:glycosyltransferase involved in cell wall biosynthesis
VVPSRFYIKKLIEWGFSEAQMTYIPNCIDTANFQTRMKIGDYYAYVGRLAPEKGLRTFIQAAAAADVRIKIVGSGPDDAVLRSIANDLGADIEFSGVLVGDELKEVISHAKALVLPSEWYENAPISVLEAYASGVPVIGADVGGIPEMIENGKTGLIFASESVSSLTQALSNFEQLSQGEILALGAAARSMAESHYSRKQHTERSLQLYETLGA